MILGVLECLTGHMNVVFVKCITRPSHLVITNLQNTIALAASR